MPEVTTSREIDAPQALVWSAVSNPQRFADWNTLHAKWAEEPPAALEKGARFVEVVKIKGVTDAIEFHADDIRGPEFVSLSGSGSTGSSVVLEFSVADRPAERSRATLHIVFTSPVLVGPLGKVLERAFRKELDASLEKLATLVAAG
ncbi:Polyketide cyclase/dehydrase [Segniliparus rotundus DSM 44985]|uniref:Polyketide cyclase/dehydrase n=1 Tax=Segniliparus rotundus (strain ATCC BAA-972 / CDC 1076 / CIP 108378 / DSM 44985 / JCM 13578) TaxID=640132 RepID=D6ZB26_SEGRD|nr:SRPBCC family protein [Segniliparus rotundus]ADG96785.1 Polyketide cyclase/dehydrase [Segniliparus rotundus DSM 44985]